MNLITREASPERINTWGNLSYDMESKSDFFEKPKCQDGIKCTMLFFFLENGWQQFLQVHELSDGNAGLVQRKEKKMVLLQCLRKGCSVRKF